MADFLLGAVVGGFVWDVIKAGGKILLNKIWEAIKKFIEKNNNEQDIIQVNFMFDDITIEINGIANGDIALLSQIFQSLAKHIPRLNAKGINAITKIIMPIIEYEEEGIIKHSKSSYEFLDRKTNPEIWMVIYDYDLNCIVYKVETEEIKSF